MLALVVVAVVLGVSPFFLSGSRIMMHIVADLETPVADFPTETWLVVSIVNNILYDRTA